MLAINLRLGVFARFRPGGRTNRLKKPGSVAFEPVIYGPIHARLRRWNIVRRIADGVVVIGRLS